MNSRALFIAFLSAFFSFSVWANEAKVDVDVTLSPAGNFSAETAKVKGSAYKKGNEIIAENVVIDARSLATGIALRDKHLKKRIMTDKFPEIKLVKAVGKDGKGQGIIKIMGKSQKVTGTYEESGNTLKAKFKIHLPDLAIKDIRYMGVGVEDDIEVNVTLPIKSEPPRATASVKKSAKK